MKFLMSISNLSTFQVEKDLLSEEQSQVFIDMIREIVKQVKQNPKQMPIVQIPQKYRQVSLEKTIKKLLGNYKFH